MISGIINRVPHLEKVLAVIPKPMPHVMGVAGWLEAKNCNLIINDILIINDMMFPADSVSQVSPRDWLIRERQLENVLFLARDLGICP